MEEEILDLTHKVDPILQSITRHAYHIDKVMDDLVKRILDSLIPVLEKEGYSYTISNNQFGFDSIVRQLRNYYKENYNRIPDEDLVNLGKKIYPPLNTVLFADYLKFNETNIKRYITFKGNNKVISILIDYTGKLPTLYLSHGFGFRRSGTLDHTLEKVKCALLSSVKFSRRNIPALETLMLLFKSWSAGSNVSYTISLNPQCYDLVYKEILNHTGTPSVEVALKRAANFFPYVDRRAFREYLVRGMDSNREYLTITREDGESIYLTMMLNSDNTVKSVSYAYQPGEEKKIRFDQTVEVVRQFISSPGIDNYLIRSIIPTEHELQKLQNIVSQVQGIMNYRGITYSVVNLLSKECKLIREYDPRHELSTSEFLDTIRRINPNVPTQNLLAERFRLQGGEYRFYGYEILCPLFQIILSKDEYLIFDSDKSYTFDIKTLGASIRHFID